MANTYYDSQLTAAEIEAVLEAINGILTQANNGKVLAISNGKLEARSVQWGGGGGAVVQPLSVTQNGTYNPPSGVDGYAPVTVNVSGGGGGGKPSSAGVITSQNVIVDFNTQTLETFFENDFLHDFDSFVGYLYTEGQMASNIDSTKSYTCYIVCRETTVRMARLMGFAGAGEGAGLVPGIYTNGNGIVYTTLYTADVSTGISGTNFFAACVIIDRSNNQVRYAVNSYRETKNANMYAWNKVSVNGQNGGYIGQMEIKHFAFVEGADDASTVNTNISALMTLYGIQ